MKIFPSRHIVKQISESHFDTDLNVPLAYINVNYSKYNVNKNIYDEFSVDNKKFILPEEEFDDINFKLFNKYNEEVKNTKALFNKKNDKYSYYPQDTSKFIPKKFNWKAVIQKNESYSIANTYNINLASINNDALQDNLIKTFMNASNRDDLLAYSNIKFNNNSIKNDSFEFNENNTDTVFIKSHDCVYYDTENSESIDLNELFDNNLNVWIGCEDGIRLNSTFKIFIGAQEETFYVNTPIVSNSVSINSRYYFDTSKLSLPDNIKLHNIFKSTIVPILILEYENKGFLILSNYTVLDNMLTYEKLMYEVLLYVHLNGYITTDWIEEWITYDVPDYIINKNGAIIKKTAFYSDYNIYSSLNLTNNCKIKTVYIQNSSNSRVSFSSDSITTDTLKAIKCINQTNGIITFVIDKTETLDGYSEIKKPSGWTSIYYNGYIYLLSELHYLIEEDILNKIITIKNEESVDVKVYNFKSSSKLINLTKNTTLTIPFVSSDSVVKNAIYTFSIKNDKIEFCYSEDYKEEENKYKLFDITISQSDDSIDVYDMRQLGGGLPVDEDDNYELLDIGHINGRPYRIAGTLVLTMPTKYKDHEEDIQRALEKYKCAEDYIAVIFKDKEDE